MAFFRGPNVEPDYVIGACLDPRPDVKDPNQELLDYIYGVDPVTGLPTGDLAIYLGDKANPEIKAFIEANLLRPRNDSDSNLSLPQDVLNKFKGTISDDDIVQFSRNHDEDNEQYAVRMRNYFDSVRAQNELEKRKRQLKKIIDASVKP